MSNKKPSNRARAARKGKTPSATIQNGNNAAEKLDPCENEPLPKLTDRQRRFIHEFLLCGNASEAARRAGYTQRANSAAAQLMANSVIFNEIERRRKDLAHKFKIDEEFVIQRLAAIASFDLRDVMRPDSTGMRMKPWADIPPHISQALSAVSESESQFGVSRSVKAHDPQAALDKLVKYLGLFKNGSKDPDSEARRDAVTRICERLGINRKSG